MIPRTTLPDYWTIEETAKHYGVTGRTIRRFISDGSLPASRLGNKMVRIAQADALALLSPIPTASAR
ncbi:MAG: helix-turn-helix domain-containing protein [Cellulomonas sp.]